MRDLLPSEATELLEEKAPYFPSRVVLYFPLYESQILCPTKGWGPGPSGTAQWLSWDPWFLGAVQDPQDSSHFSH